MSKLLLAAAFMLVPVGMSQNVAAQPNNDKVTICHRTNSVKNPYVKNTVSKNAVDGQGGNGDHFAEHKGPLASSEAVAQSLKDSQTKWGDIIPPVPGVHGGLNWTAEGQAMYNNDCNYVQAGQPATPPTPPTPPAPLNPRDTSGTTLGTSTAAGNTLSTSTAARHDFPGGGVEAGYGGAAGSLVAPLLGITGSIASLGYGIRRLRKS